MIPLYSYRTFEDAEFKDLLPLRCCICQQVFYRTKKRIHDTIERKDSLQTCSIKCRSILRKTSITVLCTFCHTKFTRRPSAIRSKNLFCSKTCAISYNNHQFPKRQPGQSTMPNSIRAIARRIYRNSGKPQSCYKCKYDKYYEVAHIRPISKFPKNTPPSIINDINNLIALCPNCHWEMDNGLYSP